MAVWHRSKSDPTEGSRDYPRHNDVINRRGSPTRRGGSPPNQQSTPAAPAMAAPAAAVGGMRKVHVPLPGHLGPITAEGLVTGSKVGGRHHRRTPTIPSRQKPTQRLWLTVALAAIAMVVAGVLVSHVPLGSSRSLEDYHTWVELRASDADLVQLSGVQPDEGMSKWAGSPQVGSWSWSLRSRGGQHTAGVREPGHDMGGGNSSNGVRDDPLDL